MSELVDADSQRQVTQLVEKLTDKRKFALDPELARNLKRLCKASEQNVRAAFDAISEHLKANHAQTRLLALELSDELFARSKAFRALLAPRFSSFLDATLGFRAEKPLPPPAAAAATLRARTMEVVERWEEGFAAFYPEIGLGCKYLRETVKLTFPRLRERAAVAEAAEAERRAQARQQLLEQYAHIRKQLPAFAREVDSTISQMDAAFSLAEGPPVQEGDVDWEDAAAAQGAGDAGDDAGSDGDEEGGGLSAYAAGAAAHEQAAGELAAGATTAGQEPDAAAREQALSEMATGCYRLITARLAPTVQRWIRTLAKVEVGSPGAPEQQERDRLQRTAMDLRANLSDAQGRYEAKRELLAAASAVQTEPPTSVTDLVLPDPDTASPARRSPASQLPQPRAEVTPSNAAGPSRQQRGTGRQPSSRTSATERTPSAEEREIMEAAVRHAAMLDPTAPASRWTLEKPWMLDAEVGASRLPPSAELARRLKASSKSRPKTDAESPGVMAGTRPQSATEASSATQQSKTPEALAARGDKGQGGLPEHVKKALLEKAVMVAPSPQLLNAWRGDGGAAAMRAARAGMEIQNHWGSVDSHIELSAEQLERFGVNHVAQYYTPPPATPAAAPAATAAQPAAPAEARGNAEVDRDTAPAAQLSGHVAKRVPGVTRIGRPSTLKLIRPPGKLAEEVSAKQRHAADGTGALLVRPAGTAATAGGAIALGDANDFLVDLPSRASVLSSAEAAHHMESPSSRPAAASRPAATLSVGRRAAGNSSSSSQKQDKAAVRGASGAAQGGARGSSGGGPPAAAAHRTAKAAATAHNDAVLAAAGTAATEDLGTGEQPQQGSAADTATERADGRVAKRKAGPSLRQRLEKRLKSAKEPGPAHSRPGRGFVFIK